MKSYYLFWILLLCCKATYSQHALQHNLKDSMHKYRSNNEILADVYADSCIAAAKQVKDYKVIGEVYRLKGVAKYLAASYEEAYKCYTKSIAAYELAKDSAGIGSTFLELGNFYKRKNELATAKAFYQDALVIAKRSGDKVLEANAKNSFGLYYESIASLDTAKYFYQEALKTYRQVNILVGMSYSLEYLSGIYKVRNEFDTALALLKESLALRKQVKDKTAEATSLVNIGEIYFAQKIYSVAISYFLQSTELAKQIKFYDLQAYSYGMISNSYKELGDYKSAFHYQDSSNIIQAKLNEEIYSKQLSEVQTQFETANKEKLIQIKDLELTEQQLKINRNYIFIIALIALIVLSSITFYLLYNRHKLKQQTMFNQQLLQEQQIKAKAIIEAEENERQRIGKDLHDGLGQLLSAVKLNFSGIESSLSKNNQHEIVLLQNAKKLLDDSVHEVRNISHNMMPSMLLQYGLMMAIEDFVAKVNTSNQLKIEFTYTGLEKVKLKSSLEIILYRVIQELLNNVLKHAHAQKISLQILKFDQDLTVMIEDDGRGFDFEQTLASNDGIGLKNIISRVNYINGSINFDSVIGKGTTVTIEKELKAEDYE